MSKEVQNMFGRIAPKYDRANRVLSFGTDIRWRKKAVKLCNLREGDAVLDVACGTGDLSFALKKAVGAGPVIGSDFTPEMLVCAAEKSKRRGVEITWRQADAQDLPFDDDAFAAATISFGIRNVDDPAKGVAEMARCVKPGGRVVVLEFGQPKGLWGASYRFYSRHVMPRVGGLLTGDRDAYEYLPRTAAAFPAGDAFLQLMGEAYPFSELEAIPLSGEIAWLYVGTV